MEVLKMSKLKTLKSLYHTNVQTHNVPSNDSPYHIKKAKISKKKYKKAYTTLPDVITDDAGYMWETGRNKMYTHYTQVQQLDLEKDAHIPDSRFKQLDRNLKMTDFLYDDVTNSDLKLIRNRLKKGHINLKGFVTVHKSYWFATHARKTATVSWIINDKYAIANVHDFLTLLKLKLI